ncbi:uncharacterized protein FRV6_02682 [Fusarium oxysporum]|uniref:Uncharacterized protein n=1 Tax=Fusarium oxysporum TaxID=5507 RepID=A0A2H3STE4_FUSOX|nr:uncharacterized protein FRV6_02682 [Fusarium oxysporum]
MQHSQSLATPNPELAINVHVVECFVQETTEPLSTYPTTTIFADITARPNPGRSIFEQTGRPGKLAPAARPEPEPELNPQKDIRILIQVRNNCVPTFRPDPTRYAALEIVTFVVESLAL